MPHTSSFKTNIARVAYGKWLAKFFKKLKYNSNTLQGFLYKFQVLYSSSSSPIPQNTLQILESQSHRS